MQHLSALLALAGAASAFPGMTQESIKNAGQKRDTTFEVPVARRDVPDGPTASETNCGPLGPCESFNAADQLVSVSGANVWQAPSSSDLRGPCPGLNAAANHAYLPRSGIAHITDTIEGLGDAYSMSAGLAGLLAVYSVVFAGDLTSQSWSIGGPPPTSLLAGGLLGKPNGLSYAHNFYEGDSSATRDDAYLNNGDAYSLIVDRFNYGYTYTQDGGYTMDSFRQLSGYWQNYSVANNPNYAAPLFSTTLVVPAAYNFVINFMSNHSAENVSGFLTPENYKTFFAITGDYNDFTWNAGMERIPDNFYKRPSTNPYTNVDVVADLVEGWAAYPGTFRFGGNTDGVNTYSGIDLTNLTGGVYNLENLMNADNFACFTDAFTEQFIPNFLQPEGSLLQSALGLLNSQGKFANGQSCPSVTMDFSQYSNYPGMNYHPSP